MKIFTKKGFLQKTIIVILMVLCVNFIVPTYSSADIGGAIFDPISDLLASIGDAVVNLLQRCMTGDWGAGFKLQGGFLVDADDYFGNESDYPQLDTTGGDQYTETIDPDSKDDGFTKGWLGLGEDYYIPVATYSPEQIFSGKVPGLDVNFIHPNKYYDKDGNELYVKNIVTGEIKKDKDGNPIPVSSAAQLQKTIASWYVALRNLAVVGLLSVLVYVGIRIIISSTAATKAKYKQLLMDWVIALCLLFFMHYIMNFTITMVNSITDAINGSGTGSVVINVAGKGSFTTNLLGAARFKTQYADFGQKVAYLIMYLALVIYTVIFTWFYLKRLLMMAFLTLVAPLVALTYPIDKIQDGKAQAFNSWIREYIFNALIQPFHLIIYMVFVGTAMDLASTNIIYMIAALGFILPAEKILRGFFGFNKAGATLGGLIGGAAIGSYLAKGAKTLMSGGSSGGGSKGGSPNTKQADPDKGIKFSKGAGVDGIELPDGSAAAIGAGTGAALASGMGGSNNRSNQEDQGTNVPRLEEPKQDRIDEQQRLTEEEQREHARLAKELEEMEANDFAWKDSQSREEYENKQNRYKELEDKANGKDKEDEDKNENIRMQEEQQKAKNNGLKNLWNYHTNGKGRKILRGAKSVAKSGVRTAFKAGAGTLAGAVALASGGGAAGAAAAFVGGVAVGGKFANGVMNTAARIPGAVRRERDIFNGNNKAQKAASVKAMMTDPNRLDYVNTMLQKEGWTDEKGVRHEGEMPSFAVRDARMEAYKTYFENGITDMNVATKAQKIADEFGIDDTQAAKILAYGESRDITRGVLNKKADREQAIENATQEFMAAGHSKKESEALAAHTFNYLQAVNDVAYNKPKNPPIERRIDKSKFTIKGRAKETVVKGKETAGTAKAKINTGADFVKTKLNGGSAKTTPTPKGGQAKPIGTGTGTGTTKKPPKPRGRRSK